MSRVCTQFTMRSTNTHLARTMKPRQHGVRFLVGRYCIRVTRNGLHVERGTRKWWIDWDGAIDALKAAGTRC